MPPDSYYSSVNVDLLDMIPPDVKCLLEVGCGTGALASRYKQRNPKCKYWGVEANAEAGRYANSNPDIDVDFVTTIEEFLSAYGDKGLQFDAIVFGDVLEHLQNPSKILKDLVDNCLTPDGHVLACVPNVQHVSVVATLLNGDWPQMDSGLFDETHIRWFTKKTIVEMFEKAGLSVAKVCPRVLGAEHVKPFVKSMADAGVVADFKSTVEGMSAYQWLIHGVKGELPKLKVLVRGFTAEGCCARPRMTEPGSFINTVPNYRYSGTPTEVQNGESVIVVRQRFNITKDAVRKHIKDGCLIVGEWDDDPWHEGFKDRLKGLDVEWALKACHSVQVSTEAIAELVRPINSDVIVLPNQIKEIKPAKKFDDTTDVVRVFMGGQRRREDWEESIKTVDAIVADDPDRYHFVVVYDRELYDALQSPHKTFYPFQTYEKYRELIRSCDVAISTLADNRFNRCKSDITMMECGAESVAVLDNVASSIEELRYSRAYLFNKGLDARRLINESRLLSDHYNWRVTCYQWMLLCKEQLDDELFKRLPELAQITNA